ncbi:hypothetical protein HZH66_011369 [Vespula vulgaris]|uniref:Uncharacterized protein n=2 Tax=Vespula TaxID=7451 RepID=A0A834KQC5_VESPE|nr:hypothetical protein HZH66_011369 [Vespula vulgaris]KAF7411013.1 hypothetical protein H0235_013620 [Vespula pensylvanica]
MVRINVFRDGNSKALTSLVRSGRTNAYSILEDVTVVVKIRETVIVVLFVANANRSDGPELSSFPGKHARAWTLVLSYRQDQAQYFQLEFSIFYLYLSLTL